MKVLSKIFPALFPSEERVQDEMAEERKHYTCIRLMSGNSEFNAVKYLYDRLNIIDSKTQALLRFNAMLISVITVIGTIALNPVLSASLASWASAVPSTPSTKSTSAAGSSGPAAPNPVTSAMPPVGSTSAAPSAGSEVPPQASTSATSTGLGNSRLTTWLEKGLFLVIFLALTLSMIQCFRMFKLKFDHITDHPPADFKTLLTKKCKCSDPTIAGNCQQLPDCEWFAMQVAENRIATKPLGVRSRVAYEDLFFKITIDRQYQLHRAMLLSEVSGVAFLTLMACIVVLGVTK